MNEPAQAPLTVAELLKLCRADLEAWAATYRGLVDVASDRRHAVELMAQNPARLHVIISYAGWTKRGDYEETRAVDHDFKFCITTGRVFTAKPGDGLVSAVAGMPPLFDLTDRLGARLHAMEFPDGVTEGTLDIVSAQEVITETGVFVDAYEISAKLGARRGDVQ